MSYCFRGLAKIWAQRMIASPGSVQEKSCPQNGVCLSHQGAMVSRERVNGGIFFVKNFLADMGLFSLHCQHDYCSGLLFCCVIKEDSVRFLLVTLIFLLPGERVFNDSFMIFHVA